MLYTRKLPRYLLFNVAKNILWNFSEYDSDLSCCHTNCKLKYISLNGDEMLNHKSRNLILLETCQLERANSLADCCRWDKVRPGLGFIGHITSLPNSVRRLPCSWEQYRTAKEFWPQISLLAPSHKLKEFPWEQFEWLIRLVRVLVANKGFVVTNVQWFYANFNCKLLSMLSGKMLSAVLIIRRK